MNLQDHLEVYVQQVFIYTFSFAVLPKYNWDAVVTGM